MVTTMALSLLRLLRLVPFLLMASPVAFAIHADQDGLYDWHHAHIGIPTQVLTARAFGPTRASSVIFASKYSSASVHAQTGEIKARFVMDEGEQTTNGVAWVTTNDFNKYAVASDGARFVRAFSVADGSLSWEANTYSASQIVNENKVLDEEGDSASTTQLIVSTPGGVACLVPATQTVVALTADEGEEMWRVALNGAAKYDALVAAPDQPDELWAVGTDANGKPALVAVNAATGTAGSVHVASSAALKPYVVSGGGLHALSADGTKLVSLNAKTGSTKTRALPSGGAHELVKDGAAGTSGLVAVRQADGTVSVLDASFKAAELKVLFSTANGAHAAVSSEVCSDGKGAPCAVAVYEASENSATVKVAADGGKVVATLQVGESFALATAGAPLSCHLAAHLRKDGGVTYRAVVVSEGGEVAMVHESGVVWQRDESLAPAKAVVALDPPQRRRRAAATAAAAASVFSIDNIMETMKLQFLQTKVRLHIATPEETALAKAMSAAASDRTLNAVDLNGLRKNLVVLGAHGRLVSLHSGDGRKLWATHVPIACASKASSDASFDVPSDLRVLRAALSGDSASAGGGAELLVVGRTSAGSYTCTLDGHTGAVLEAKTFDGGVSHVLQPTHVVDSLHRHPVILVVRKADGTREARAVPNDISPELKAQLARGVHFYEADAQRGALRGYAVTTNLQVSETWAMNFPGRHLLSLAQPQAGEAVHSHVKVLGDRSVLYRHINPNLLFVASGVSPADTRGRWTATMDGGVSTGTGSAVAPADASSSSTRLADRLRPARGSMVHVHLLDAVSGRVLYSISHDDAVGPVRCVISENFVVYMYHSLRHSTTEVSVLELYDDSARLTARTVSDVVFEMVPTAIPAWLARSLHIETDVYNQTMSAHAPPPLRVLGQSYFLSASVRAMGISQTLMGLASKLVYFAEEGSGQVFSVDKRLLDPRRPVKVEATHREEGLMQYSEHLPMGFNQFSLTHGHNVALVSKVVSFPSRLESTCHVVVLGLDMLYHRMQPSASFDTLNEDFSHAFLVLTITALAVGSVVTGRMAKRADLKVKWR